MKKLSLCLLLSGCAVSQPIDPLPPVSKPIYLGVNQSVDPKVEALFPLYHAEKSMILYQGALDANNDGIFDGKANLEIAMEEVPLTYTGPLALDWEGKAGTDLYVKPLESKEFLQAVEQFILALKAAKELRPLAKIGFYGLPYGTYWMEEREGMEKRLNAMDPIHQEMQAFFPSLYEAYKVPEEWSMEADMEQVKYNITAALLHAHGKPIYAYIATRYLTCCGSHLYHLIHEDEMNQHIDAAFVPEVKGDKIDGIIWWGADQYSYWVSQQLDPQSPYHTEAVKWEPVFKSEIQDPSKISQYWIDLHTKNLKILRESLP